MSTNNDVDEEARFVEVLKRYSATYAAELKAQRARLDELVGAEHWLSVGTYKEALLRRVIRDRAPKFCEVGTGFVVAQFQGKKLMSKQVDILIWDSANHVPLFRDGEFVIVPPEACLAAIEVKGNLGSDDLADAISNLERITTFARFTDEFGPCRPIFTAVFAFSKKNRRQDANGKDLETSYVAWPATVFNRLWKLYDGGGDAEHTWPLPDRIQSSRRQRPRCFEMPWIRMVAVLDVGFVTFQEWALNGSPVPTYAAFDSSGDRDRTYSALFNELTRHLLAPDGLYTYDRPGLASVLLFGDETRSTPAFMPLEKPNVPINSIGQLSAAEVQNLADSWHRPRGASSWPKLQKGLVDDDAAD